MDLRPQLELHLHGWRARVRAPRHLLSQLEELYSASQHQPPRPDHAAATTTFAVHYDAPPAGWQHITRDAELLWSGQDPEELLAHLEWAINRTAAEWLGQQYLLFHAGSVAFQGSGLILPAPSGSGKTTLVAGLVAAGFEYLSDEVAMVDPHQLRLLPFAKSLSVKAGAREVLAPLYPSLETIIPRRRFGGQPVWFMAVGAESARREPVPLRRVVLPSYQPQRVTELRRVDRSVVLKRLLEQSFNMRAHGAWAIGRLIELLRQADCYTLSVGSLDAAVHTLLDLARECDPAPAASHSPSAT